MKMINSNNNNNKITFKYYYFHDFASLQIQIQTLGQKSRETSQKLWAVLPSSGWHELCEIMSHDAVVQWLTWSVKMIV